MPTRNESDANRSLRGWGTDSRLICCAQPQGILDKLPGFFVSEELTFRIGADCFQTGRMERGRLNFNISFFDIAEALETYPARLFDKA